MDDNYEKALEEEFPFMKKGNTLGEQQASGYIGDLYSAFGCECDNGWYELIRSLCKEIVDIYTETGLQPDIHIEQIKEKFGTLRFYVSFTNKDDKYRTIHDAIYEVIDKYEDKSSAVCEHCGKSGTLRTDRPWIQTLCDECAEKRIK